MRSLKGKVAVITGAGSGIGAAVAERLHALSAEVVLLARTEMNIKSVCKRLSAKPSRAMYCVCDVAEEASLLAVREKILEKKRKIDILVTCAAAPAQAVRSEEMKFESWRSLLRTDLDGAFLSCKVFGAPMLQQKYGRIVNMTSFHTVATYPARVAYNAAKSGVEGLTRALAVEWGRYGVTVNAVAPGPIRTPRTSFFLSQSPEVEEGMIGRTPLAKIGETSDVAALIAFLVSDEAGHISGQQIVIDGGWTKNAWWGRHKRE